jgi:hypothetical protein
VSSINPVFQPTGPTVALASGAPVQVNPSPSNNLGDCFRIVNTTTTNGVARISWGRTAATTPVPAAAGPNNIYLAPNESIYLCLPPDSFFNLSATGTVEVTPGIGGAGG